MTIEHLDCQGEQNACKLHRIIEAIEIGEFQNLTALMVYPHHTGIG